MRALKSRHPSEAIGQKKTPKYCSLYVLPELIRSSSPQVKAYPLGEKHQGQRRTESDNALTHLTLFSSSVSQFDFAKLPRKRHFRCHALSCLIDKKGDGGRVVSRTCDRAFCAVRSVWVLPERDSNSPAGLSLRNQNSNSDRAERRGMRRA